MMELKGILIKKKTLDNNNMLSEEDRIRDKYILFMKKDINFIKNTYIKFYEKKI